MAAASLIAHLAVLSPGKARADASAAAGQGVSDLVPCDSRVPASGYTGMVNIDGTPTLVTIPDGATRIDQILIGGPFRVVSYCGFMDVNERGAEDDALAEPMQVLVLQDLRHRGSSFYDVVAVQGTSAPVYNSTASFAGSTLVIPARADDHTESHLSHLVLHVDAAGNLAQVIDPAERERQIGRYQALHPVTSSTPVTGTAGSLESHAGSDSSQPETPLQAPEVVAYRVTHHPDGTVQRQPVRATDSGRFILAPGTYAFDYDGLDARLGASAIDVHNYSRGDATSDRGVELTITDDTMVVSTVVQQGSVVGDLCKTYEVRMLRTDALMPMPRVDPVAAALERPSPHGERPSTRAAQGSSLLDSSTFWGVVAGAAITGIGVGLYVALSGNSDRPSGPYDIAANNRGAGDR